MVSRWGRSVSLNAMDRIAMRVEHRMRNIFIESGVYIYLYIYTNARFTKKRRGFYS